MKTLRLFIALPISEEIRKRLKGLQEIGRGKSVSARWVAPDKIHLTLVFLGWTDPALQEKIEEEVDEGARLSPPFTLHVGGLGVFPRLQAPKVIWAGVEAAPDLIALQRQLSMRMAGLGFELDARPYSPHLTLGRVESLPRKSLDSFAEWITEGKDLEVGRCSVKEVVLMKSELQPGGSIYINLFASKLRGAESQRNSPL